LLFRELEQCFWAQIVPILLSLHQEGLEKLEGQEGHSWNPRVPTPHHFPTHTNVVAGSDILLPLRDVLKVIRYMYFSSIPKS
jgi:hypothetical protein